MIVKLSETFGFHAAHYLPNVPSEHKCGRMHGHSYKITVSLRGEVDEGMGWFIDYAELKGHCNEVKDTLDHRVLNHILGLENPTCENLSVWIFEKLKASLKGLLISVTVRETESSRCKYSGVM